MRATAWLAGMLFVAAPVGCDDVEDGDGTGADTSASADDGEPSGPPWEITYSGAHEGMASGLLTSAVSPSMGMTVIGGSNADADEASVVMTLLLSEGETGSTMADGFTLRLDGGIECDDLPEAPIMVVVNDGALETYDVDFSGTLDCDGAPLELQGFLRR